MKRVVLVLCITILLITSLSIINAQLDERKIIGGVSDLEKSKDGIEGRVANLSNSSFLVQQWTKLFEETAVGKVFTALSPIFVLFTGIPYSTSWIFFLSLIIAIAIFIFLYRPIREFLSLNPIFAIVIPLTILGLISINKVIPTTLESMSFLIPTTTSLIILTIILGGVVWIYWILIKKFGKQFKEMQKKELEKERELRDKSIDKVKDTKLKSGDF